MTNVSTNMEASRDERNALSAVELDAVSGGSIKAIDIRVAGMHITSNYDLDGHFHIMVQSGDTVIRRGGAV
jgi:hypothetical protein